MNTIATQIADIIAQAEKFRSVYFWRPEGSAGGRRSMERRESRPEIQWQDGKDTYTAAFEVSCYCSHTEARGVYTKNGRKTTLTAIRNSARRMGADV